jgi:hypothetical protein
MTSWSKYQGPLIRYEMPKLNKLFKTAVFLKFIGMSASEDTQ